MTELKKPKAPRREFKGVFIPKAIWEADTLTWMEKCLLAEIDSLDDGTGCFASNEFLASRFGSTADSIKVILSKLKSNGWIKLMPKLDSDRRFSVDLCSPKNALPRLTGINRLGKQVLTDRLTGINQAPPPHIIVESTNESTRERGEELPLNLKEEKAGNVVHESHSTDEDTFLKNWREKGFPKILKWTPDRREAFRARMRDPDFRNGWPLVLDKMAKSDFLMGWRGADVDWVLNPKNWVKILEGKYDNRAGASPDKRITDQQFRAVMNELDGIQGEIKYCADEDRPKWVARKKELLEIKAKYEEQIREKNAQG